MPAKKQVAVTTADGHFIGLVILSPNGKIYTSAPKGTQKKIHPRGEKLHFPGWNVSNAKIAPVINKLADHGVKRISEETLQKAIAWNR